MEQLLRKVVHVFQKVVQVFGKVVQILGKVVQLFRKVAQDFGKVVQACSQVSVTESASMVMSWPVCDMHLPSFHAFKTAKNFMSPVGHAVAPMAHR